jgi:hypothetical protein
MHDRTGGTFESGQTGVGLDAVDVTAKPIREARAVKIEFVDASGSNFAVMLGQSKAAELVVHLVDALSADEGGPSKRMREAQLLLRALMGPHGHKARWVARRLGVGDSTVSQ